MNQTRSSSTLSDRNTATNGCSCHCITANELALSALGTLSEKQYCIKLQRRQGLCQESNYVLKDTQVHVHKIPSGINEKRVKGRVHQKSHVPVAESRHASHEKTTEVESLSPGRSARHRLNHPVEEVLSVDDPSQCQI